MPDFKPQKLGNVEIKKRQITLRKARALNERDTARGLGDRKWEPGVYNSLYVDGVLMMDDSPVEIRENLPPVRKIKSLIRDYNIEGRVLITGLGLGVVLERILAVEGVSYVTVVESNPDVIRLVAPYFDDGRVNYACKSAFEFDPVTTFDLAWHDIWPELRVANLYDFGYLEARYRPYVTWQGFWGESTVWRLARGA